MEILTDQKIDIMTLEEFILVFADQFDDTDLSIFAADTYFHELEEWSSLTGLAILNMIGKKFNVTLAPAELRACETIEDVYNAIQEKL